MGSPPSMSAAATGRLLLDYLADGDRHRRRGPLAGDARPVPRQGDGARPASRPLPAGDGDARPSAPLPHDPRPLQLLPLLTDPRAGAGRHAPFLRPSAAGRRAGDAVHGALAGGRPAEQAWPTPRERVRPEDGATVRHWSRAWYDPRRSWSTRRTATRSSATARCWRRRRTGAPRRPAGTRTTRCGRCTRRQASPVRLTREWSGEPAAPKDSIVTAVGTRP